MAIEKISDGSSVQVKIYSRLIRGRTHYEVRDHRAGHGQTYRKFFTSRPAAREFARQIAQAIRTGTTDFTEINPAQRRQAMAFLTLCQEHGKEPDDILWRLKHQWHDQANKLLPSAPLVAQVVEEYVKSKERQGLGTYHVRDLQSRLGKFAAAFTVPINRLFRAELEAWLNALPIQSPRTWNNYRNSLVALFTFAKECNYLSADWKEMAALKKAVITEAEPEILTPAELRTILETASPDSFRMLLAIGAFTGIRSEEIFKLAWEDFDWERPPLDSVPGVKIVGTIFLRRKIVKGQVAHKRQRQVPLPENLRAWLIGSGPDRDLALEGLKQRSGPICEYKNPKVVAGMKTKLAERLGIAWKKNALRKSWISYQVALTKDPYKVSSWAGNSVTVIKNTYERLVSEQQALEWFAVYPTKTTQNLFDFRK
mgnify:CR=1 FL=1